MPRFPLKSFLRGLLRRSRIEREMQHELEAHIERYSDDLIAQGMPRSEALRRARAEFGGLDAIKEDCRDALRLSLIDELRRNAAFGFRMLRKSPSFSIVAILSLALAISLNTTAFGLVNVVLFRSLPVVDPERLVFLDTSNPLYLNVPVMSYPDYKDLRDNNTVLSDLVAYRLSPMNLTRGAAEGTRVWGFLASGNYFQALGVSALIGRTFTPFDDQTPRGHPVAVLSYRSWQSRFGADPAIINKSVKINGLDYTIIGVLPSGFRGTEVWLQPELWIPMMMQPQIEPSNPWLDQRGTWNCWVLGRLKDGVSRAQAESGLQALATQISKVNERVDSLRIRLQPPGFAGSWLRPYLLGIGGTLFAATALVLLAACLNIASLLLARGSDRSKEIAVRLALGASRSQVSRQLLTESLLLALMGGGLGFVFTAFMIQALAKFPLPTDAPVNTELALDYRVLAFAVLISVLTSLIFGAVPAFRSTGVRIVSGLKQESRFRLKRWELRDLLVTVQIAVTILLLSGAALVVRSTREALHLDFGFNPRGVVSLSFDLALQGYNDDRGLQFQIEALRRIEDLPGVQSAGLINSLPLTTDQSSTCVNVEERSEPSQHCVYYYHAAPGYFRTMQSRIVAGRDFESSDRLDGKSVAIVNQSMARMLFGRTEEAIGKRIGFPGRWREVVGVVEDGRYISLGDDSKPILFYPSFQRYYPTTSMIMRSSLGDRQAIELMRAAILELDPNLSLFRVGSVEDHLQLPLAPARIAAGALTASSVLAIFLAATGVYGVMAYAVARRTREIGIRIAVGATPRGILRMVTARGLGSLVFGLIAGVVLTLLAGSYLRIFLYGVTPTDPFAIALAALVMAMVVAAACFVPARRATRIDPVTALRSE